MTKIKKYFKLTLTFVVFAVLSFVFALSPVFSTIAAASYASTLSYVTDNYNLFISSVQVPKGSIDLSEGDEFIVPLLSSSFGESSDISGYTIRVIDPAGQNHDYVVDLTVSSGDEGDEGTDTDDTITSEPFFDDENLSSKGLKVNVQNSGKYTVVYIVTIEDYTFYSNTYTVTVKNVSYELDFIILEGGYAGLEMLLPSYMKTTSENIELPVANVKVSGEDTYINLDSAIVPVVTYNGAVQTLDADGSALVSETAEDGTTKYYLVPGKEGKYTIEYTYNYGANRPSKTYVIEVTDDFVAPNKSDLTITVPTLPSVELGDKDVELPSLTVSDGLSSNAAYNITSIEIKKMSDTSISQTLTNNTLTFNMTTGEGGFETVSNYKDLVGNYTIEYTIEDAYGNSTSIQVKLANVTDNTSPKIYMAYNYTVNNDVVDDVDTTYAVDLKGNYGYSELVFPAIYATDAVSSYNDFTFVRYIQNTNTKTIYYLDNYKLEDGKLVEVKEGETGYNYCVPTDENDTTTNPGYRNYNMAVKFSFTDDESTVSNYSGEYVLGYYVTSSTVKSQETNLYASGTTRYTFNILSRSTVGTVADEDSTIYTTPSTSISNIKNGATVSTTENLAVYISATDEGDSRLKNVVFYYYSSDSSTTLDGDDTYSSVFEKDLYAVMNTILADLASDTNNYKCNILDDPALITGMKNKGYSNFAMATQDEDNSLQFEIAYTGYNEDTNITVVAVSLNDFGNVGIDSKTLTIENSVETNPPVANIVVLSDNSYGDLIASSGGIHTVMYNKKFDQAVDVVLPAVSFTDSDTTLSMSVVYYINSPESTSAGLQYLSPANKQYSNNTIVGGKITTSEIGTYYVVYTATDDAGNTTTVFFTFVVVDSSDPVLSVEVSGDNLTKSGNTVSAEVGTTITFDPTLYNSKGTTDLTSEGTITLTIEDNGLNYSAAGQEYSYVFEEEGDYTIRINAEYNGRSAVEKVIYVKITMSELAWDSDVTLPEYAGLGKTVYLPDLTASQGSITAVVTVTVLDPDGHTPTDGDAVRTVYNGAVVWAFKTNSSSKGTYTVTYTATTAYGSITQTYEIRVGDNVAPAFIMSGVDTLSQELVYDGENEIEYIISLSRSANTLVITVKNGDTTLYTVDTELEIWDADDSGSTRKLTSWTNLTVVLSGDNVTESDTSGTYYISGTGKCTLTLTMTDSYSNTATKTIEFNVVSESDSSSSNKDTIIGTVLIVISLLILAGVILFFTFTGKEGTKSRSSKKVAQVENVESTDVKSDDDGSDAGSDDTAKTGEVE